MNHFFSFCIVLLAGFVQAGKEELPGKKVTIGPDDFSDIYPAVWFCPDDANITGLRERSERPPEPKYRIWIEPRDPEINTLRQEDEEPTGLFLPVGHGTATYKAAKKNAVTDNGKRGLDQKAFQKDKPVFLYQEKNKAWACLILELDRDKNTMVLMWRELE